MTDLLKNTLRHVLIGRWIPIERDPRGISINHARWMLENLPEENDKAGRWLGYAQALMVVHGIMSLEEMRDVTRECIDG